MERIETSTRGRHALTAMVDLSRRQGERPVPLSEIAASRQISLSYLEQMFSGLRRHGLVKSHRGPGGGYVLALPAKDISVAAVIRAAEDTTTARSGARRTRHADETTGKLWEYLGTHVSGLLDNVSLDDVIAERVEVYQKVFKTLP